MTIDYSIKPVTPAFYAPMDEALDVLGAYGPDLTNGLTNHAPMAAEAMCALGRPDAVMPWIERYRTVMIRRAAPRDPIAPERWRAALGLPERYADWFVLFERELESGPWPTVLNQWMGRLAPGISASATHGVIRVGHAVRCLDAGESAVRVRELADALASFASTYQELPTAPDAPHGGLRPSAAIERVAVMPPAQRKFTGTITSSLDALDEFPEFASVIGLIDVNGDAPALVSELTESFARVYLANAHDFLTAIVFVHSVTSIAALRSILPHLDQPTARAVLRFAWQTGCGLYAAFGSRPTPAREIEAPREAPETLIDMALAHGDEHAIKFTEACLREHTLRPSPAYPAAARDALNLLGPATAEPS